MPKSTHSRIVREGAGLLPDHIAQAQREAAIEQATEDDLGGSIGVEEAAEVSRILDERPSGDDPTSVPDDEFAGLRIEVTIGSTCACGCGDKTSAGRSFVQGHDQRLIGLLAANHAQEVQFADGGMLITTDAIGYAARVFSSAGLAKLDRAIDRAKVAPVASRSAVRTARQAPAEPATALGAEVTIKVGRHTYPATVAGMNQAGKITAVQYVQKTTGATKVAQEGSFSLV